MKNAKDDLRNIVKTGKEQGLSNYEALKSAGVIKEFKGVS